MSEVVAPLGMELWRGVANAWECDHLGHFNSRHYLRIAETGSRSLIRQTKGLDGDTGRLEHAHLRFVHEARPGTALHLEGALIGASEGSVTIAAVLWHSREQKIAATFRLQYAVSGTVGVQAISLSEEHSALLARYGPRSLSSVPSPEEADRMQAATAGLLAARTCLSPRDEFAAGRIGADALLGIVSDGVPHVAAASDWQAVQARSMPEGARVASVLAEFVLSLHEPASAGDSVDVRYRPSGCSERALFSSYALVEPITGKLFATAMSAGIPLDLTARKVIGLTPEAQEAYLKR